MSGLGYKSIASKLEAEEIRNGAGNVKWYDSSVKKILTNEKYMGDALLQKTITVDFLTHKRINNKGEAQQYYVEDSHPAIISKELFQKV